MKTPRDVIVTARNAAASAMGLPAVNKRLTGLGYVLVGSRPEEFTAFIGAEIEKLGKIIRAVGAKIE
ncbi:Tripartite tricarboxylate transporter family receptor [compost metagenome]